MDETKRLPAYEELLIRLMDIVVSLLALVALVLVIGVYPAFLYPLLDSATRCILSILGG